MSAAAAPAEAAAQSEASVIVGGPAAPLKKRLAIGVSGLGNDDRFKSNSESTGDQALDLILFAREKKWRYTVPPSLDNYESLKHAAAAREKEEAEKAEAVAAAAAAAAEAEAAAKKKAKRRAGGKSGKDEAAIEDAVPEVVVDDGYPPPDPPSVWSVVAGAGLIAANRLRVVRIHGSTSYRNQPAEDNWTHFVGEVDGSRYRVGGAARPELEVHIVGVGAKNLMIVEEKEQDVAAAEDDEDADAPGEKKKKGAKGKAVKKGKGKKKKKKGAEEDAAAAVLDLPKDESGGSGVEVFFDPVKCTYIIHEEVEDKLILLFRNDPVKALQVDSASIKYFDLKINAMDHFRSRIWRRFVRVHLRHRIWDRQRFAELTTRWDEKRKKQKEADAQALHSDTDSNPPSDEEDNKKISNLPAVARRKGGKSGKKSGGSGSESEREK